MAPVSGFPSFQFSAPTAQACIKLSIPPTPRLSVPLCPVLSLAKETERMSREVQPPGTQDVTFSAPALSEPRSCASI